MNIHLKSTEKVPLSLKTTFLIFSGEWLNSTQSLNEQGVPEDAVLLVEKKFFVTDATLSTEDPLTLHLVYIQCRDSILAGKHPMTEDEALSYGALQCQILYGNFDPSKNKVLE
jgi:talin